MGNYPLQLTCMNHKTGTGRYGSIVLDLQLAQEGTSNSYIHNNDSGNFMILLMAGVKSFF